MNDVEGMVVRGKTSGRRLQVHAENRDTVAAANPSAPIISQKMAKTSKIRMSRMPAAASVERTQPKAAQAAEPAADPSNRVAELQVSAHLMTLETGLFCVFQTPGSAPPDAATGLPGVRITPAPGIAGRPE